MSGEVGRAGFHVRHTKDVGERRPLFHEQLRSIDEDAMHYWAQRNHSIVVRDDPVLLPDGSVKPGTGLGNDQSADTALVNDGRGGYRPAQSFEDAVRYGDERVARVKGGIKQDKRDKNNRMRGGTMTTTALVSHLPKSLCIEVPDYYDVLDDKDGTPVLDPVTGQTLKRSRWIARDKDEAQRYFDDCLRYMEQHMIPDGQRGVLSVSVQYSESTPHMQVIADTFAPVDQDEPGGPLRSEASRRWFVHRDVLDDKGKVKQGKQKMREMHEGLKQHLIERGYPISPDFDEQHHDHTSTKEQYAAEQEAKLYAQRAVRAAQQAEESLAEIPRLKREAAASAREQALAEAQDARAVVLAETRHQAAQQLQHAQQRARSSELGAWLRENRPEALSAYEDSLTPQRGPRTPAALFPSRLPESQRADREVLVTYLGRSKNKKDAGGPAPVVELELNADDPAAHGQTGLVLSGRYVQSPGKEPRFVKAAAVSNAVMDEIVAKGHKTTGPDGRITYGIRADLVKSGAGTLALQRFSIAPSRLILNSDWETKQQDAEERGQEAVRQSKARTSRSAQPAPRRQPAKDDELEF